MFLFQTHKLFPSSRSLQEKPLHAPRTVRLFPILPDKKCNKTIATRDRTVVRINLPRAQYFITLVRVEYRTKVRVAIYKLIWGREVLHFFFFRKCF